MDIASDLGLTIYGGDATGNYAHSPETSQTYLAIDEVYTDCYNLKTGKDVDCCHVLSVCHYLQENPKCRKIWIYFIDNIIINEYIFGRLLIVKSSIYWSILVTVPLESVIKRQLRKSSILLGQK